MAVVLPQQHHQQLTDYWLSGLPRQPSKEVHDSYSVFTFSMQMLPSINARTTRGTHTVRAEYREQELTEVARIAAQRDAVRWNVSETDAYLILYVLSFESQRSDIHNPVKPTCDLFGQGRYDWEGSGRRRHKVWTDHAWVVWNDNRVWDERVIRVVSGKQEAHWATISIVKFDRKHLPKINPHRLLAELGERFDPRPRDDPFIIVQEEGQSVASPTPIRRQKRKGTP